MGAIIWKIARISTHQFLASTCSIYARNEYCLMFHKHASITIWTIIYQKKKIFANNNKKDCAIRLYDRLCNLKPPHFIWYGNILHTRKLLIYYCYAWSFEYKIVLPYNVATAIQVITTQWYYWIIIFLVESLSLHDIGWWTA